MAAKKDAAIAAIRSLVDGCYGDSAGGAAGRASGGAVVGAAGGDAGGDASGVASRLDEMRLELCHVFLV